MRFFIELCVERTLKAVIFFISWTIITLQNLCSTFYAIRGSWNITIIVFKNTLINNVSTLTSWLNYLHQSSCCLRNQITWLNESQHSDTLCSGYIIVWHYFQKSICFVFSECCVVNRLECDILTGPLTWHICWCCAFSNDLFKSVVIYVLNRNALDDKLVQKIYPIAQISVFFDLFLRYS